ncbi:FemAB family PEP-CTERM system-associated protein [Parasalinivibrio latis]|uniref:FemAB family XrtA/PEP-CTERM system-associated protein n=1 Tax=Parasalinivibrio latis TaxID=2952610 RepID=UPI0030E37BCD
MTASLQILPLDSAHSHIWDAYVDTHPEGSFFHLSGWRRVVENALGHRTLYLMAWQSGAVVGLLPLVRQKSMLFGHTLVSTPFCVYGGALADDEEIRLALECEALERGQRLGVDHIELRDREAREGDCRWQHHCSHAAFWRDIDDDPEQILTSIKRKQRAVVRHSLKNGLSWEIQHDVDQCYDIYSESVRNLGTPVFSRRLFRELKKEFGSQCEALVVKDADGNAVSAVLSFYFRDQVLPYYGGGIEAARALKSNDYMYYQLMCHAASRGYRRFDFGRSKKDSGSYKYKQHWGMTEEALHYRCALVKAKQLPNLSPNNPRYAAVINMWKRLPLGVSRQFGPVLSRYLG